MKNEQVYIIVELLDSEIIAVIAVYERLDEAKAATRRHNKKDYRTKFRILTKTIL